MAENGTAPRKRLAPVAAPPAALQKQVARSAKVIQKHAKVLGQTGLEAIKIATLQVVAQHLADLQALLKYNGLPGLAAPGSAQVGGAAVPVPASPKCAICGHPAIHKAKHAMLVRGTKPPWYCQEHLAYDVDNISEGPMTPTSQQPVAPPAPQLPPHQASIKGALAALIPPVPPVANG